MEITFKTVGSGSYPQKDVIFLLKDLSSLQLEGNISDRENRIQNKQEHYSESLPIEKLPDLKYLETYRNALQLNGPKTAALIREVSDVLFAHFQQNIVFVSLARAGTPVGILLKTYFSMYMGCDVPHYSVSIIRGKGLDLQALRYIKKLHKNKKLIFLDGWTGKGSITKELIKSCEYYSKIENEIIEPFLAVLSDPAHCATVSGTKEDVLIPHACLNATVSGLISRTVHNRKWTEEDEYHGAKFYQEWLAEDESNNYIQSISSHFSPPDVNGKPMIDQGRQSFSGLEEVRKISMEFSIENLHLIKPSIGETTRVLLRRVPWKVLVRDIKDPQIKPILELAHQKNVEVIEYTDMTYRSCGIIKPLGAIE